MQTIAARTDGDLMARWRTTGGDMDMMETRQEMAGDDGLQATSDDGLRQAMHTRADPTFCL